MTAAQIAAYSIALLIAVATPGPAMLAVLAIGVSRGRAPALKAALGVAFADVVLVLLAIAGLAALASAYAAAFTIIKYAGGAYLIWLGIRMWRSPAMPEQLDPGGHGPSGLWTGAAIGLGNPKAILFHASLMPLILDVRSLAWMDAALIAGIVFTMNMIVMAAFALAAAGSRRWLATPKRMGLVNRSGGAAMIGVGALVATR